MSDRNVVISYTEREFPEGTIAGKVLVSIISNPPIVTNDTFEFDGNTEDNFIYTFLAGVEYTISAMRVDNNGQLLGNLFSTTWLEPVSITVKINVPTSITVV